MNIFSKSILVTFLLTMGLLSSITSANELGNPGFEDNTSGHSYGNNFSPNISPWTPIGPPNVVQVDGPGGTTWYDEARPSPLGPRADASSSPAGVNRHYLDMQDDEGSIYQAFTTPEECSGEVRFGGFFSTRGNASGVAHIEIREGTGMTGNLIGTTAVFNVPLVTNTAVDPWTPVNFVTTLSAGTTYSYVIWMDNQLNFDEAYVNFVDGPCKDDSDLVDEEPQQCLILEPKVECVANKWQVSISNTSNSDAEVMDITSLTPGVTISGTSPNWILNGALPNSAVDISVDGTVVGGGSTEFADLCCSTELHIDIPDEVCEIIEEKPHIYTRKTFDTIGGEDAFLFVLDSLVQINEPTVLKITDTIPIGVTLTSLDSSNAANWSCPSLPITGPATLECTYEGAMPIPAGQNFTVIVYADIEPSEDDRENCIATNLVDTNGDGIPHDGNESSCVVIPSEEEDIECGEGEILVDGQCEIAECVTDADCPAVCINGTCGGVVTPPSFEEFNFLKVCETSPHPVHVPFTCKISVSGLGLDGSGIITISDVLSNLGGGVLTQLSTNDNWSCDSLPANATANYTFDCSLSESDLVAGGNASEFTVSGHFNLPYSNAQNCISSTINNGENWPYMSGHCWKAEEETQCQMDADCLQTQSCNMHPTLAGVNVCQHNLISEELECGTGEVLIEGECVPDESGDEHVPLACNSNIVIVADESGSIAEANARSTVQYAIKSFVKGFKGNGSKAAVIHFDTTAELEDAMTEIATSPNQEVDFIGGYNPSTGYTNWEAGLKLALAEVTTTPGSIVFFITDGQPNRYLDSSGNVQTGTEAQSVAEAVAVANQIKSLGSRIIAIGVGDILGSPNAQANLNSIASSPNDAVVDELSNLNQIAVDYATQACPDIYLDKKARQNYVYIDQIDSTKPEFTITVTNNTLIPLTGISVQDALPSSKITFNVFLAGSPSNGSASETANVITWSGISLAPAASATLKYSTNVISIENGEKVYNFAEVTAVDQTVTSVNPLTDPVSGPLNPDDKDEGKDYIQGRQNTVCTPTSEEPDKCIYIQKTIINTEGACLPGNTCKYRIRIRNRASTPYTGSLNLSDSYTPSVNNSIIGISVDPSHPTSPLPVCATNPTWIPFTCVQDQDIPGNTWWSYIIETIAPTPGVEKNCITLNNSSPSCAIHPSTKSLEIEVIEEGITIEKFAPKTCKAGQNCEFTFEITNNTSEPFKGFAGITDKPKKRFGRIRGKSKGWSCQRKGDEYRCGVEKLTLKPSESKKVTLTLQVPKKLSDLVENCATIETEESVSKKSCAAVEITNDNDESDGNVSSCGYDDKRINGRCVPRCSNKNSNWNGVDCMVCSSSKVWNDRYKRCDKKPREVIKSCPAQFKWSASRKRCVEIKVRPPACEKDQRWDSRLRKCVSTLSPKCNKGTKYDVNQKRCVEIKVRPPGCGKDKRWDARVRKCVSTLPPKCNKGTKYDVNQKRCIEIKVRPPICNNGTKYSSKTRRCEVIIEKKCDYGYKYNQETRKCQNTCGTGKRLVAGRCVGIRDVINIYNIFKGRGGDGGGTPNPDPIR